MKIYSNVQIYDLWELNLFEIIIFWFQIFFIQRYNFLFW